MLAALAFAAPAAPADAAPARPAATCGQTVAQTRQDLANVGAPTSRTDWQGVRDDAQRFVDSHPYNGSGTTRLRQDINELNAVCAP
ncbi:hypothetical protein VM98_24780 [Streptomyces rubellomurinus subsp. indigoferus]|uniref:Uncharacterized protein n=1 Tax=Streptomyces rubellomurinus (strain ATCC 31215) TaxID=359131 RepID=A0A0F2TL77_STRR3|nr:hypothetical protein VM98_24780 [Streptomyces rubellomurinus subsp. indigoferus]KJS63025.1 hypothetical protein VM95_05715 [Streptomyces rubellomurinus]